MRTITFIFFGILIFSNAIAQSNEQKLFPRTEYAVGSLGKKLQAQFGKHCQSCSVITEILPIRDYIPRDIKNHFDREELESTLVESIPVKGSALLRYVFLENQRSSNLDKSIFTVTDDLILNPITDTPQDYDVVNSKDFPSFLYTTNCASLVNLVAKGQGSTGAAVLSAAVDIDNQRKSSLYTYVGLFKSPLNSIINDKNARTTELMLNLWQFYQQHPNYVNKAYFLKEFRGLTIGRTISSEQYRKVESTVGINLSAGMASVNIDGSASFKINSTFSGTDFETFLYNKFTGNYKREDMFGKLPDPNDIVEYFKIPSVYNVSFIENNELMSNGNTHTIYLNIDGVPQSFINAAKWKLSKVDGNAYEPNTAELTNVYKIHGKENSAQFVISGIPNAKHFSNANPATNILVSFSIETNDIINNKRIEIPFTRKITTTVHPIPKFTSKALPYSFTKLSEDKFTLSWKTPITFIDNEKAVNYALGKTASATLIELLINGIKVNAQATLLCSADKTYELSISTVDDFSITSYTLLATPATAFFKGTFNIPLALGGISQKSINLNLEFPDKIKKTEAEFIPSVK